MSLNNCKCYSTLYGRGDGNTKDGECSALLIGIEFRPKLQQFNQLIGHWDPRQVPQRAICGFVPVSTEWLNHLWGVFSVYQVIYKAGTL